MAVASDNSAASFAHGAASSTLGVRLASMIADLSSDGVLVSDDDGVIVVANHHVDDMFGHDHDALVGAPVECLLPVHARTVHRIHRQRYSDSPRTRPMGAGLELFGLHADGTEFPIEISLSAVTADDGPVTVAVIRDLRQPQAREQHPQDTAPSDENELSALNDRIVHALFASGLSIASILSENTLDDRTGKRLREVLDQLDAVVRDIRNTDHPAAHTPDAARRLTTSLRGISIFVMSIARRGTT